jgi:hypothetical protein
MTDFFCAVNNWYYIAIFEDIYNVAYLDYSLIYFFSSACFPFLSLSGETDSVAILFSSAF